MRETVWKTPEPQALLTAAATGSWVTADKTSSGQNQQGQKIKMGPGPLSAGPRTWSALCWSEDLVRSLLVRPVGSEDQLPHCSL